MKYQGTLSLLNLQISFKLKEKNVITVIFIEFMEDI